MIAIFFLSDYFTKMFIYLYFFYYKISLLQKLHSCHYWWCRRVLVNLCDHQNMRSKTQMLNCRRVSGEVLYSLLSLCGLRWRPGFSCGEFVLCQWEISAVDPSLSRPLHHTLPLWHHLLPYRRSWGALSRVLSFTPEVFPLMFRTRRTSPTESSTASCRCSWTFTHSTYTTSHGLDLLDKEVKCTNLSRIKTESLNTIYFHCGPWCNIITHWLNAFLNPFLHSHCWIINSGFWLCNCKCYVIWRNNGHYNIMSTFNKGWWQGSVFAALCVCC